MLAPVALLALLQHGGAFDHIVQWHGVEYWERMGQGLAAGRDLNGDTVPDFCVGSLGASLPGSPNLGYVEAFDGATLLPLWRRYGDAPGDCIGTNISFLGDQNGDTVPEILASCPDTQPPGLGVAGSAWVLSGSDGSVLLRLDGRQSHAGFGQASIPLGDLDRDGVEDFAVAADSEDVPGLPSAGRVRVFRGGTFQLLGIIDGVQAYSSTGYELAAPGDLNGDMIPDLICSASRIHPNGGIVAFSGANGAQLWFRLGRADGRSLGDQLAVIRDRDGDAIPDVLATNLYVNTALGSQTQLVFLSGKTGALLQEIPMSDYSRFGRYDSFLPNILEVGDVNGDSAPDIALCCGGLGVVMLSGADLTRIGSYQEDNQNLIIGPALASADLDGDGKSEVFIGDPDRHLGASNAGSLHIAQWFPALTASRSTISASAGGEVRFTVRFALRDAGRTYVHYGSLTGTGPTLMNCVPVPLDIDSFYHRVHPNPPTYFQGATGALDATGGARARLRIPPGVLQRIVGRTLNFCAALPDAVGLPEWTSVAVSVDVLP